MRWRVDRQTDGLTKDDKCEAVEACSDVSEDPAEDQELDGVDEVLDQEEGAESRQRAVHILDDVFADLVHFIFRYREVELKQVSESTSRKPKLVNKKYQNCKNGPIVKGPLKS